MDDNNLNEAQKIDNPNSLPPLKEDTSKGASTQTSTAQEGSSSLPPLEEDADLKVKRVDGITTKVSKEGVREIQGPDFEESNELDEEEYEKEEKEKKHKKNGKGCRPGISCRSCSCFGCLTFLIIIVLLILTIYFRPPFVINGVKKFLNKGYTPTSYEKVSSSFVLNDIRKDLSDDNIATVSEMQMQALVRDALNADNLYVDVEPNYIRLVSNLSDEENPLWLIFELGQGSDGSVEVTKVGFNRLSVPSFLESYISSGLFNAIDLTGADGEDTGVTFMKFLLDSHDENIEVKNIRFDKDEVVINNAD